MPTPCGAAGAGSSVANRNLCSGPSQPVVKVQPHSTGAASGLAAFSSVEYCRSAPSSLFGKRPIIGLGATLDVHHELLADAKYI